MSGSSVLAGNLAFALLTASRTSLRAVLDSNEISNSVIIVAAFSLENELIWVMPSSDLSSTSVGFASSRSASSGDIPS